MVKRFADQSTHPTRAFQAWLILIGQARLRRTLTYGELDKLMGFGFPVALGPILDYIFWYCKINELPPLALIVVSKGSGKPGTWEGMDPVADVPRDEDVFDFDWYSIVPPTPEELKAARKDRTIPEEIMRAVFDMVYQERMVRFSREDIRLRIGVGLQRWDASYSPTFQGMRADQPGGAPNVGAKYKGVFRQVEHGTHTLTPAGVHLLTEYKRQRELGSS